MANAYAKIKLSGSTDGRNVKVVATATAGTLIHTAHATLQDEVWLWANNTSAADVLLTVEEGGVTSPDDLNIVTIAAQSGKVPIMAGQPFTGGVIVRAFAATTAVINISGFVNRITS